MMKSKSGSANPRDGVRMKVLKLIALLAAIIFVALLFERSHSQPPVNPHR